MFIGYQIYSQEKQWNNVAGKTTCSAKCVSKVKQWYLRWVLFLKYGRLKWQLKPKLLLEYFQCLFFAFIRFIFFVAASGQAHPCSFTHSCVGKKRDNEKKMLWICASLCKGICKKNKRREINEKRERRKVRGKVKTKSEKEQINEKSHTGVCPPQFYEKLRKKQKENKETKQRGGKLFVPEPN